MLDVRSGICFTVLINNKPQQGGNTMATPLTAAAAAYIAAKAAEDAAKAAKAKAEAALLTAMAKAGTNSTTVSGTKVTATEAQRRKVNAEALGAMIAGDLFAKVTAPAVDLKRFDAAVEIGEIGADVAAAVTTATPYVAVRVTKVAAEAKADIEAAA
jgi:hypothetical protein